MDFSELITALPNWIGRTIITSPLLGYGAILTAMFLENLFPPIPSELIMPLAGFYVQQGYLHFVPVTLSGLLGTVLGALPWYGIGRLVNEQRIEAWLRNHGRWLGISVAELQRTKRWFERHGRAVVFWGRLVPGIRTLISVPAGMGMMPLLPFLVWTTLGSLIWTALLCLAGLALGEGYRQVAQWIDPVSSGVKVLLVITLVTLGGALVLRVLQGTRSRSGR